ncbi:MAG: choice-of-anchor J domain-containing protein [Paludibacter sp.]|nr:choice-of-anchor J domain-containing protein [Paludibacter sp.]
MKKFTMLILAALFAASGWSQETIQFGTGTETTSDSYFLGGLFGHTRSAVLYTQSELEALGMSENVGISKIALQVGSMTSTPSGTRTIKIWVKEVTNTVLTTSMFSDWATLCASANLVYDKSGSNISIIPSAWNEFSFTTPYEYNGGNLLIFTDCIGISASGGNTINTFYHSATTKHWKAYKDDAYANPLNNSNGNCSTVGGVVDANRSNIRITFDDLVSVPNRLKIIPGAYYTQIPTTQILPPVFAKVKNTGSLTQTNVVLSAAVNGTSIGTSSPVASLDPAITTSTDLVVTPVVNAPLGSNTLVYTVSSSEGATSDISAYFKGTTNTYAVDSVTTFSGGVGANDGTITIGNVFQITTATALLEVQIGFGVGSLLDYSLSLYAMTGDLTINSTPLFTKNATRNGTGLFNIVVPETALSPGKYFLCVNQLTTTNVALTYDGKPTHISYVQDGTDLIPITETFNGVAIRMITGDMPTCIRPEITDILFTNSSATVSLTENGTATQWQYVYSTNANADPNTLTPVTVSENPFTVLDLNPNTQYYIWVRSYCSATDQSLWIAGNFRTACGVNTVPYIEDFESYVGTTYDTAGPVPNCWYNYAQSGSAIYTPHVTGSGSYCYPHSGTNALTFTGGAGTTYGGPNTYAVLPPFDTPIDQLMISFWFKQESTSAGYGSLSIGYITGSQDNIASYTPLYDVTPTTTLTQIEYMFAAAGVDLSNATYIALRWNYPNTSSYYSAGVDDVNVYLIPTCPKPTLTSVSVTATSATVTLQENGSATQWQYVYSTDETANTDELTPVTVTDNPFTVEGLQPNTVYYGWVRSICDATDQSLWAAGSFRTDCGEISIPLVENFTGWTTGSGAWSNPCWRRYNAGVPSTSNPYINASNYSSATNNSPSGTPYLYFSNSTSLTVVLPPFDVNVNTLEITYWTLREGDSSGTFSVGYLTNSNDPTTFVAVETNDDPIHTWYEHSVILGSVPAGINNIAFRQNQTSTAWYYWLDDIDVHVMPACPKPTITSTAVTSSSASVSFFENGSATQWEYVYSTSSTTDPNTLTPVSVTDNPFPIEGLTPNTQYYIWIRSICDATDQSLWTAGSFRTACTEYSLPFTENFSEWTASSSYFDPCWTKYTGSDAYSNYPYVSTSLNQSLYFYVGDNTTISAAFLPQLDAAGLNLTIEFDLAMPSSGRMDVVTATNPQDQSTWTVLETISNGTGTSVSDYHHYEEILIPNYQAGTYIGFKYYNTSTYYSAYLDNINVDIAPNCTKPVGFVANNITGTSADLSWTPIGTETEWVVEYSTSSTFATLEGTENVSGIPSLALSSLSGNTQYYARVKAVCSSEEASNWTTTLSFRTPCEGTVSLPYIEDFESYIGTTYSTSGPVPGCWYTYAQSGNVNYTPHVTSTTAGSSYCYPHSGTNAITFTGGSGYGGVNTYAVLPIFDTPINKLKISFWYKQENASSGYGNLSVGYITGSQNNISSYVSLYDVTPTTTLTQIEFMFADAGVDLTNATYIVFRWNYTGTSYYSACIDDVNVNIVADNDAAISAITAPVSGINLTNAETVTATIFNNGLNTITSLDMELTVDNGTPVVETFNTNIAFGATANYTFTATADLSVTGNHTIKVRAILPDDEYAGNDSQTITVTNTYCGSVTTFPFTEGFEGSTFPPACWTALQVQGTQNWARTSDQYYQGYWSAYQVPDLTNMLKTALVTPPLEIPATGIYSLKFWSYTDHSNYYDYSAIMVSTTSSSDITAFSELKKLTGTEVQASWQNISVPLSAYSGQTIYLAFVYQGMYAQTWYIDDVNVSETNGVDNLYGNHITITQNNGEIFITVTENSAIRIIDVSGRVLGIFNASANSTFSTYEPAGLYLIEVRGNSGVSTHKLLVK